MLSALSFASAPPALDRALTWVELVWYEKRIERWIRFGQVREERILDRRRRLVGFAPGDVFAFVRWQANERGTVSSRLDILQAVDPGGLRRPAGFARPSHSLA